MLRSSLQRGVCGGVVTSNHETADGLSCFDAGLWWCKRICFHATRFHILLCLLLNWIESTQSLSCVVDKISDGSGSQNLNLIFWIWKYHGEFGSRQVDQCFCLLYLRIFQTGVKISKNHQNCEKHFCKAIGKTLFKH